MPRSLVLRRTVPLGLALGTAGATALILLGGGPPPASAGGGETQTIRIRAVEDDGLAFSRERLRAAPGRVRLVMSNPRGNDLPHAIEIERGDLEREGRTVRPGGTSRVTLTVRRGTYTFYCPVGQHRRNGMEGRLTVR